MNEQQFNDAMKPLETQCAERISAAAKTYAESGKSEQDYWKMEQSIADAIHQFNREMEDLHFRYEQDRAIG